MTAMSIAIPDASEASPSDIDRADMILRQIIPRYPDGFSLDPWSWTLLEREPNVYLCSLAGFEARFRQIPPPAILATWMTWVLNETDHIVRRFLGYWRDGAFHYFDISVGIHGLETALQRAIKEGQQAIYDALNGTVIELATFPGLVRANGQEALT